MIDMNNLSHEDLKRLIDAHKNAIEDHKYHTIEYLMETISKCHNSYRGIIPYPHIDEYHEAVLLNKLAELQQAIIRTQMFMFFNHVEVNETMTNNKGGYNETYLDNFLDFNEKVADVIFNLVRFSNMYYGKFDKEIIDKIMITKAEMYKCDVDFTINTGKLK